MKKTMIIMLVVFAGATSCTKNKGNGGFQCTCTVRWGVSPTNPGKTVTYNFDYGNVDRSTALANCELKRSEMQSKSGIPTANNGYEGATCNLK